MPWDAVREAEHELKEGLCYEGHKERQRLPYKGNMGEGRKRKMYSKANNWFRVFSTAGDAGKGLITWRQQCMNEID